MRSAEQISDEDRILLQSVARAVFTDSRGTLARAGQAARPGGAAPSRALRRPGRAAPRRRRPPRRAAARPAPGQRPRRLHAGRPRIRDHDDASGRRRRRRGSTCWPIRTSAASSPRAARPTPGARTRTSSASRRGTTIRSATRAARPSTCATRRPATSGRRRRCPAAARAPTSCRHGFGYSVFEHSEDGIVTELTVYVALDAAGEVRGAEAAQRLGPARAGSRRPATWNGCWATCGRNRACTWSPRSIPTAARCSRATPTTRSSPGGSRSSTSTT